MTEGPLGRDPAERALLERVRRLCRSRLLSARRLWQDGLLSEAYGLSSDVLQRLLLAHESPAEALAAPLLSVPESSSELSKEKGFDSLPALLQDLKRLPRPVDDAAYTAAHAELLDRVWAACRLVDRHLADEVYGAKARRRARTLRACLIAGAVLAVVTLVLARPFARPKVSASASYSPDFQPSLAVDGLTDTDWLLPDGQLGWIELRFPRPRDVAAVRLFNSRNRDHLDRGAQKARVTVYSGGRTISRETELGKPNMHAKWMELSIRADEVTRLRVDILSTHGLGGGLAEIDVE